MVVFAVIGTLLLVFQLVLIARALLDWATAVSGTPAATSVRGRITTAISVITEPVLAPVRRVIPPLRLGNFALDTSFIVVFLLVLLLAPDSAELVSQTGPLTTSNDLEAHTVTRVGNLNVSREAFLMGHRADLGSDIQRLLNKLCIKLGFCLPPEGIRRLCESPPGDVDSFTDEVFEAEGMGDVSYTDLRRQVREVVDQNMSRWGAGG